MDYFMLKRKCCAYVPYRRYCLVISDSEEVIIQEIFTDFDEAVVAKNQYIRNSAVKCLTRQLDLTKGPIGIVRDPATITEEEIVQKIVSFTDSKVMIEIIEC